MIEAFWRHESGGWHFVSYVPCYIVKQTDKRVTILALKRNGELEQRNVKPENIILAPTPQEALNQIIMLG